MSERTCSIDGCGKGYLARGFCSKHYQRWKANGDPLAARERAQSGLYVACTIEGCGQPNHAGGLCTKHYQRWKRHGDPLTEVLPPSGSDHWSWRAEITYKSAHDRVRRSRGRASSHTCQCGESAAQWAYDGLDASQRSEVRRNMRGELVDLTYSVDPMHYTPLCRSCHIKFDKFRAATGRLATQGG